MINKLIVILCLSLAIFLLINCENKYPDSVYDPDASRRATPEILSISPPDSALAGVGQIIIVGKNFAPSKTQTVVFFNNVNVVAEIIEITETQIIMKSPSIIADSIGIRIASTDAEHFSNIMRYKLKPAVVEVGKLLETEVIFGIAIDLTGNVYISNANKQIKKIAPDGKTSLFKTTTFLRANNMKMGPNNVIYVAPSAGRVRNISTIDASGKEGTFVSLPNTPNDLDFDINANIWVAVDKEIYIVKSDKSVTKTASFPVVLLSLRVFNGYVYVTGNDASTGESKIWRAAIQGENLSEPEVVLDVANAGWLAGANVLCLTFAADGEMILGTDHPSGIFRYHETDGSYEVLYAGLIEPEIYAMSWDEGNYVYAVRQFKNKTTSKIYRIDMGKKSAPYYGRK